MTCQWIKYVRKTSSKFLVSFTGITKTISVTLNLKHKIEKVRNVEKSNILIKMCIQFQKNNFIQLEKYTNVVGISDNLLF